MQDAGAGEGDGAAPAAATGAEPAPAPAAVAVAGGSAVSRRTAAVVIEDMGLQGAGAGAEGAEGAEGGAQPHCPLPGCRQRLLYWPRDTPDVVGEEVALVPRGGAGGRLSHYTITHSQ